MSGNFDFLVTFLNIIQHAEQMSSLFVLYPGLGEGSTSKITENEVGLSSSRKKGNFSHELTKLKRF